VDVGARAVDRERHPPDIADLGQILDIDPVIGQFGADRLEVLALRAELIGEVGEGTSLQSFELVLKRRATGVAALECPVECGKRRLGIGDDADGRPLNAGDLDRVDVDADQLQITVEAPAHLRLIERVPTASTTSVSRHNAWPASAGWAR